MKSTYDGFMSFFEKRELGIQRKALIPLGQGDILEIGAGTGVNLQYYDLSRVKSLMMSDYKLNPILYKKIEALAQSNIQTGSINVEKLPFNDNSFDTVVVTLVFCSVYSVNQGLKEIKRVLKPSGQLIFVEHVLPEKQPLKKLFHVLTPFWKVLAGNCHLNRDFLESLSQSGFTYKLHKRFFKTAFISGVAKKN